MAFKLQPVPLAVELRAADGTKQWISASGFAFEAYGRWFWITADHLFHGERYGHEGLDTLPKYFPFLEARFAPITESADKGVLVRFGPEFISGMPDVAQRLADAGVQDDRTNFLLGLDIAVAELSPYYRDSLKACGVVPLTSEDIFREYDPEFLEEVKQAALTGCFGFYVVGTPKSSYREDITGVLHKTQKELPIREVGYEDSEHRFTPLWTERSLSRSVGGMSGGPIFAIVGDRAFLNAVQSAEKCSGGRVEYLKGADAPFMCRVIEDLSRLAPEPV